MVKRGRFVGHSVDRFRYNAPCTENGSTSARNKLRLLREGCRAVAIVPFDRNRSVSRVLEISLVPDSSRNGSNPDFLCSSVVSPYFEIWPCSQKISEHDTAANRSAGHAGGNALHTGASFPFSRATETPYVVRAGRAHTSQSLSTRQLPPAALRVLYTPAASSIDAKGPTMAR
jgi:hypothetical protein